MHISCRIDCQSKRTWAYQISATPLSSTSPTHPCLTPLVPFPHPPWPPFSSPQVLHASTISRHMTTYLDHLSLILEHIVIAPPLTSYFLTPSLPPHFFWVLLHHTSGSTSFWVPFIIFQGLVGSVSDMDWDSLV